MQLLREETLRPPFCGVIIREEKAEYRSNRKYKDSLFRLLFGSKGKMLELFNALEGTHYSDEEMIRILTLEEALFNQVINDLAFEVTGICIVLVEHQTTKSENLPSRMFIYLGRILEKAIDKSKLYKKHIYQIPVLRPYLLYHGTEKQPAEQILKLSSAYMDFGEYSEHPVVELEVKMININSSASHPLLDRCSTLREYVLFIESIREKMERRNMDRDEAITAAIKECIDEGILAEFLKTHGSEVYNMLFDVVTYDDLIQIRVEEATEEVTEEVTKQVTRRVTNQVTKQVTKKLTEELTGRGIQIFVSLCREVGLSETETRKKLEDKYELSLADAKTQLKKYWN